MNHRSALPFFYLVGCLRMTCWRCAICGNTSIAISRAVVMNNFSVSNWKFLRRQLHLIQVSLSQGVSVRFTATSSGPAMTGHGRFETLGFNLFASLHVDTWECHTQRRIIAYLALNCQFIRQGFDVPADKAKPGIRCGFTFLRVALDAALTLMGLVIKLNGGDDGCRFVADHKVVTHAVDTVVPLMKSEALLYTKNPRHLHLCENDMIGKRLDEPVVQNLLRLCEQAFHIERPSHGTSREAAGPFEYRKDNNQRENKQYYDSSFVHG
jgi:hypothetical protein